MITACPFVTYHSNLALSCNLYPAAISSHQNYGSLAWAINNSEVLPRSIVTEMEVPSGISIAVIYSQDVKTIHCDSRVSYVTSERHRISVRNKGSAISGRKNRCFLGGAG